MSSTSTPLRFGILGCGNIAHQFAHDAPTAKHSQAVACASRSPEKAQAFAQKHPQPQGPLRAHGSYEALLDAPDVDAIYLTLPNTLHRTWTVRALQAGKHVLCEKPLATTVEDAQAMFAAAEQSKKTLLEAYMYRAHPLTHAVVQAVQQGIIGDLRFIRASFCYATQRVEGNIRFDPTLGGGALWDIGGYCLSYARILAGIHVGNPTHPTAIEPDHFDVAAHRHPTGVDDYAAGSLSFDQGRVLATFTCGMTAQADNTLHLGGTTGYLELPVPWKPKGNTSHYRHRAQTPPKMDQALNAPPTDQTTHVPADADLYALEADAFAQAIQHPDQPAFMPPADSLGNLRLLQAMQQRIATA